MQSQTGEFQRLVDGYRESLQKRFFPPQGPGDSEAREIRNQSRAQEKRDGSDIDPRMTPQGTSFSHGIVSPRPTSSSEERSAFATNEPKEVDRGTGVAPAAPAESAASVPTPAPTPSREEQEQRRQREELERLAREWTLDSVATELLRGHDNGLIENFKMLLRDFEAVERLFQHRDLSSIEDAQIRGLLGPLMDFRVDATRWASYRLYEFLHGAKGSLGLATTTQAAVSLATKLSRVIFNDNPGRLEAVLSNGYNLEHHQLPVGETLEPGERIEPLTFIVKDEAGKVIEKALVRKLRFDSQSVGGSA
jgi:hypothetical protein